jgi:hypothetical protein
VADTETETRRATALQTFISGFALLLDARDDDPAVVELARAAVGTAFMGKMVLLYGHGRYGAQVVGGKYRRPLVMEITGDTV